MMKIIKFPLSRFFIYSLFGLTLLSIFFVACKKENVDVPQTDATDAVNKQKVLDVKTWFEKNKLNIGEDNLKEFDNIEPQWESVQYLNNFIVVDYLDKGKSYQPILKSELTKNKNRGKSTLLFSKIGDSFNLKVLTFLLFYRQILILLMSKR